MSFLRAQGHPNAARYPLCTLWAEARLAQKRLNAEMVTQALLMQTAVGSVVGGAFGSKDSAKPFNELVKRLTDGA